MMPDKPTLQPPSQPRSFSAGSDVSRYRHIAIIGFILLAIAALVVILVLPNQVTDQNNSNRKKDESVIADKSGKIQSVKTNRLTTTEAINEQKQIEAKTLLIKTLKMVAQLENQDVKTWGSFLLITSYSQVMESLLKANLNLDSQSFDEAVKGYNQTIEKLEQLSEGREKRLQISLKAGQVALFQFNSTSALQHFEIAFAIDPTNEEAQFGIKRTKVMDQVLNFISKAKKQEEAGNLDLARESYRRAISLDGSYQSINDDFQRINRLILEQDFKRAMSNTISALEQKNLSQARIALNTAKKLRPNDSGVKDLELQLKKNTLASEIQNLTKLAVQYEQEERWKDALDTYIKILSVDANAVFAQSGKLNAEKLVKLYEQVEYYIENPKGLQTTKNMDHARKIYEAAAKRDSGPVLQEMLAKLSKIIKSYSKAVKVSLQSDNMTNVIIYKVGRFDKFQKHLLELGPGQYKALGTRSGYRDVIVPFTVPLSGEEVVVSILCKEKI